MSERALGGHPCGDPVIDAYVELSARKGFDPGWTRAFLDAMEADLVKREYATLEETLGYVYGSAEVIGLFMARILDLPERALPYARLLGRSMQYINFIRDIAEDRRLGRRYPPVAGTPLAGTTVDPLDESWVRGHPGEFRSFLAHHLRLYRAWQAEAEKGFRYIPRRLRIPIMTASDMYNWTAARIERRPPIVFRRRVKPPASRIVAQVLANALGVPALSPTTARRGAGSP
jgi:phytoene synthase